MISACPSPPRTRENWLGTDDQGRDVLARLIYGFRISCSSGGAHLLKLDHRHRGGAVQGYFGAGRICSSNASSNLVGAAGAVSAHYLASIVTPNFWCCSASCCSSPGCR